MSDELELFLKQNRKSPKEVDSSGDKTVAHVIDEELSKLGWSDNARLSFLGDVGRENAWNRNTIFGGHSDPKNNDFNRGIISWQGSRRKELDNYLKREGVFGRNDDDELRGMVRFADEEMKNSPEWKGVHSAVRKPDISTYEASENLRKYIKYVPDAPYNSYDPEFRVKNNAVWANKARKLGLSGFASFGKSGDELAKFLQTSDQNDELANFFNTQPVSNALPIPQAEPTPTHPINPAPAKDAQTNIEPNFYATKPDEKISYLTSYRQTVADELVRAHLPPRKKILEIRLAQIDGQLKAAQAEKAAAPTPTPTNPINPAPLPGETNPTTYTKREIKPGETYYQFEQTGKTEGGDDYLGMVNGKHRFKTTEGDEIELDEQSKNVKSVSPFTKRITLADEKKTVLTRQDGEENSTADKRRYSDEFGNSYQVGRDGKIESEIQPSKDFSLTDASGRTYVQHANQEGLKPNQIRVGASTNAIDGLTIAEKKTGKDGKDSYSLLTPSGQVRPSGKLTVRPGKTLSVSQKPPVDQFADTDDGTNVVAPTPEQLAEAAKTAPTDDVSEYQTPEEKQQTRKSLPKNLDISVPVSPDKPIREAISAASRNAILSGGYGVTGEDVDAALALPHNRLQLSDKSIATDTILSEAAKSGIIQHTVGAGLIRDALAEQEKRINRNVGIRSNVLAQIASGQPLNDDQIKGLAAKGIYLKDIPRAQLDEAQMQGAESERKFNDILEKYKSNPETRLSASILASRDMGRISNEDADELLAFQNERLEQIRANEGSKAVSTFDDQSSAKFAVSTRARTTGEIEAATEERLNEIIREHGSVKNLFKEEQKAELEKAKLDREYISGGGYSVPLQAVKSFTKGAAQVVTDLVQTGLIANEISTNAVIKLVYGEGKVAPPAYTQPIYKAVQALDDKIKADLGDDPRLKDGLLLTQIPETFGQLSVQILTGYLTGGATVPTLLGAAQGATGQYKEAVKGGADANGRAIAAILGGGFASPDAFLFSKWFKGASILKQKTMLGSLSRSIFRKLQASGIIASEAKVLTDAVTKGFLLRTGEKGVELLKSGGFEVVQETSENHGNDLVAYLTYDKSPERLKKALTFGTKEDAKTAIVSFLAGGGGEVLSQATKDHTPKQRAVTNRTVDELLQNGKINAEEHEILTSIVNAPKPTNETKNDSAVSRTAESDTRASGENSEQVRDVAGNGENDSVVPAKTEPAAVGDTVQAEIKVKGKSQVIEGEVVSKEGDTLTVELPDGKQTFIPAKRASVVGASGIIQPKTSIKNEPVKDVLKPVKEVLEKPETAETENEFSSTQVNLPKTESEKVLSVGRNLIKDEDIHPEEGREDKPHITVKFGLHTNESAEVKKILANGKPFEVTLGKTSIFPAKEGADYDVVKVDAFSPELHRLNKLIADNTETTDTHPTFQPHVTLAYVKAGEGEKYVGDSSLEGTKLTFNSVAFSDKNSNQVEIPLSGKSLPENAKDIPPSPRTEKEKKINNELRGRTHKAVGAIFGKNIAETYSKSNLSPASEMSAPIRILKKIVTRDSDEHKAYQQQLALNPDKIDLIPEVESLVKGDEVQMSLEAGEISRVVSAVINNENIETASLIGGLFIGEDGVASFAQVLNDLADVAEQNGVDRRPLDAFRDNILEAAAENGTVVLSVFPEAVPHERLHQSRYLNTAEKEISGRYADFNKVFETESDTKGQSINQKAFEAYFKDAYFAGKAFEDLSAFEKAELHEETFAATARGDYERLGLSDEEAARFLEADLDSYVAKNGDKILDDIERYFDERVKTFDTIRRVRERRASGRDSKSDTSLQSEEGGKQGRDAGLRTLPESEARAVESNESNDPSEPAEQSGKLKTRQTILSAEESGAIEKGAISGDARYYTEKSRTESEGEAQDKIERDGLARAFADSINPNTPPTAEHAALQLETVKLLNRQADEATAAGNPIAAQAKLNQSVEIMLALAPEATNAGQFISQLASMNKTNPDTVAGYVQKSRAKKNYRETLTPEQSQVLRETAEKLQSATERVVRLEDRLAEIEKQLADEGETKESVQTKLGKTKPLSSVEKSIAQNLQTKAEEAAVRLKDQFNLSVKKSNPILKMASPIKSPITITQAAKLDEQTLNDLSTVGAEMLLSGLKGNPITIVDFKRSFFEQFGESVRPYLSEIHALSVKELQKIKKGAYRARAVETLRSITGNEDLTLEDLSAIVEKQIEERKEKAKIRAEHTTAADRFFNIDKIDAKERAREEKEKVKADLPSFAKSLFKVAATENKEVLLGAFYLETGQVKTADELARKLREAFPNLSSREALNASSIAARSRLLAHRDLQNERSKLKSEKTKTEAEVKKVRKERNAAQRQLLNRIKYLENPPAGYFERVGRVQKAFIVAAVQTTVNNFLTAEGSRKLVAATDLAEVLLNKGLAKAGREFDYENKLSSETRIQDIFSFPESEDYTVADVTKHYFTDAIFARGIANSVLDEYPTLYEAMFGSYASDVDVVKARTGADGAADWAMQKVEKAAEHVNVLNYLQEFLVRSQEFNYALQLRLGQKGLNLADIIKNNEVADKISEEDLKYAVHRALQVTFALKPDKTTNFGKLASLYQESVPSILQPYLVTFPNYLYNATKFVSDYAPLIGFAKAGIKTARSNEPFLKSYTENVNPRVAAQQLVGTALFLAALQLVRAAGDDDKWYYLKTPMTDKHGKNYYIDVRGYQPFASMMFLANKFNRYSNDKPMFTDSDAAVSETLEALSGFSSRNIEEGKMLQAIWRGTLGRRGDDRDAERVWYLLQQEFGDRLGGWLRPLKIFKDLVAQFDVSEAKQPDVIDHPFKAGIARSLPFANQLLGLDPKKDFVTGKESVQPMPIFRIFGINIVNPDFHKEIPSKALVMMREMSDRFKSEKDILPEHARKAAVKASLYRAMREAGDNKEEQKKVSESIKRAENLGFLEAGELEFIERQKGLAEIENLAKKLGYEKIGIAFKVATDSEKVTLSNIVQEKAEGANKRRDLTEKDVETIKKFLPDFRIELRPPITIYEKIKSSTTDEAVELYQDKESDLSNRQKEDFKSFIKQKAENANDAGKLTDNEINNIKKVIPDFQILRSLPSEFEKMPSEFEKKFESLEVDAKNPQKKVSIKKPSAKI